MRVQHIVVAKELSSYRVPVGNRKVAGSMPKSGISSLCPWERDFILIFNRGLAAYPYSGPVKLKSCKPVADIRMISVVLSSWVETFKKIWHKSSTGLLVRKRPFIEIDLGGGGITSSEWCLQLKIILALQL